MTEIGSSTSSQASQAAQAAQAAQPHRRVEQAQPQQPTQPQQARDTFERSAQSAATRSNAPAEPRTQVSDGFLKELYGEQSKAALGDEAQHISNHASHGAHDHDARPSGGDLRPPVEPARVSQGPNGQTVVNLGNGNDNVRVRQNADGSVQIDQYHPGQATDGSQGGPAHSTTIPPEQARNLRINGNDGDDNIEVDDSVTHGLTIDGGRGNDRIVGGNGDDHLIGGEGNDHIEGRGGNDRIEGGDGDDQLYGGQGNDHIDGGNGNDFIHGGDGDDVLLGGAGNDQLFGGRGNDRLIGGDGDDVLAGGEGDDIMDGGRGRDRVYTEGNDRVAHDRNDRVTRMQRRRGEGRSIDVEGSARFQERMRDDLDALASTPQGRELLRRMDATGKRTRISEARSGAGLQWDGDIPQRSSYGPDGRPGPGVNPHIQMQDRAIYLDGAGHLTPSAVILAHELAHAYDMATGRMNNAEVPNENPTLPRVAAYERDAVGLPHPAGRRPPRPTENDIRREWNMPRRRYY